MPRQNERRSTRGGAGRTGSGHHQPARPEDGYFLSQAAPGGRQRVILDEGTQVDRFRILRHLGGGSLGEVYLARDNVRREDVALKVVEILPGQAGFAAEQLQQERQAYDRILDHSRVLKVHDVHVAFFGGARLLLLSMEFADGGTLRDWLAKNLHSPLARHTEGLEHFRQACGAVTACHDAGILHLDVKPENLLFVRGVLKLADFSIASLIWSLESIRANVSSRKAAEFDFGTAAYMSPEQFGAPSPEVLDQRSVVYSLGVLLYEVLDPQGQRPFGGSYERLCLAHSHTPPRPLRGAPEDLTRVVSRCLEKDPDRRYQTVGELLDALDGDDEQTLPDVQDDRAIEEAWQQIGLCLESGDLARATTLCRRLLADRPDDRQAADLLRALEERYQQAQGLYDTIDRDLDNRGLGELMAMLQEAVTWHPEHPSGYVPQVRLMTKARRFYRAMRQAASVWRRGDFGAAKLWLDRAREISPETPEAENACRSVAAVLQFRQETRRRIDQAIEAGDGRRAMAMARELDEYLDALSRAVPDFPHGEEM